ncbi:MAG: hypothetical protein ACREB3_01225, partial [Burkholderiales bacterium]
PPGRHKLAVDSGGTRREFDVNVAGRYALVSIRMLGAEAYIAATPPVPEQKARNDMQRIGLR